MTLLQLFQQGGFVMYPLLVCSIIVWAVALHKYFNIKSFLRDFNKMEQQIHTALNSQQSDELKFILKNGNSVLTRAHEPLFEEHHPSNEALNDKLGRRLQELNGHLKKDLWIIGTIASSSPFIGLFGTVMGIMESFKAIGTTGKSGFSVVAAGISESLIATAAGIGVAVIAVIFYNYLQTKVNGVAQFIRHRVEDTAEMVSLTKARK